MRIGERETGDGHCKLIPLITIVDNDPRRFLRPCSCMLRAINPGNLKKFDERLSTHRSPSCFPFFEPSNLSIIAEENKLQTSLPDKNGKTAAKWSRIFALNWDKTLLLFNLSNNLLHESSGFAESEVQRALLSSSLIHIWTRRINWRSSAVTVIFLRWKAASCALFRWTINKHSAASFKEKQQKNKIRATEPGHCQQKYWYIISAVSVFSAGGIVEHTCSAKKAADCHLKPDL